MPRRFERLSTAPIVIDKTGFEPMNREEASLFFRLVTYHIGCGSILITTNKSVRDWIELLAGDEVLTAAILDRKSSNQSTNNGSPPHASRRRPVRATREFRSLRTGP